jgi:hypothetical protein
MLRVYPIRSTRSSTSIFIYHNIITHHGVPPRGRTDLRAKITLPVRHGGLELRRTCASESRAAYLVAAAWAQIALRQGPTAFHPFSGSCGDVLHPLCTLLRDEALPSGGVCGNFTPRYGVHGT